MNEKSSGENHMDLTSGRMNGLWGWIGTGGVWVTDCKITSMKNRHVCRHVHILLPFMHVYKHQYIRRRLFFRHAKMKNSILCKKKKKKIALYANFSRCCQFKFLFRFGVVEGRMNGREMKRAENWERIGMNWDVMCLFCLICYYGCEIYEVWA